LRNRSTVTVSTLLVLYKLRRGSRKGTGSRNRSTVTVSTLLLLDKRVKEGHRLEKPEHCDRE
jgi:hypothetical protein